METRLLITVVSLFVAASHQTCSTTDAHGIPSCPLNAALDAGNAIGLLQTCQYNICCWCSDTNFTSQLNETWKSCSEADRDEAYQFFQSECNAQDPTNTTSSQNHTASSNSIIPSGIKFTSVATSSSFSATLTPSSSSTPTVHASLSSSSPSSTSTTSPSPTHANRAVAGKNTYDSIITIAFMMAAISYLGL